MSIRQEVHGPFGVRFCKKHALPYVKAEFLLELMKTTYSTKKGTLLGDSHVPLRKYMNETVALIFGSLQAIVFTFIRHFHKLVLS